MSLRLLVLVAAASASSVVKYGSHKPLDYWTKEQRVSAETEHEVVVAVRQRNLDRVEAALADVSDPRSPRFRAHWTPAQLRMVTMGNGSDARATIAWLVSVGARVTRSSVASEFVRASAPVGAWEAALGCEFHWYSRAASARHDDAGRVARCDADYSLPASVSPHVSAIFSVSNLPPRVSRGARSTAAASGAALGNAITPAVLDTFYAIDSNTGSKLASQAVFETSGQTFSPDDLATFEKTFNLPSDAVDTDVGGHSSDALCEVLANECTEANLDVQYMMAVSQGTPMTYYYVDSASDPFLAFAEALASMAEPILVSSISYGSVESDNTASVMEATNAEAMKLGLLGGSIFVSSGDDGVTNYATTSKLGCAYNPSYPATCPYVTAVGATYASSWAAPGEGEIVCQSNVDDAVITSGGGFSATFAAPNYTASAVAGYFDSVTTAPLSGYTKQAAGSRAISSREYIFPRHLRPQVRQGRTWLPRRRARGLRLRGHHRRRDVQREWHLVLVARGRGDGEPRQRDPARGGSGQRRLHQPDALRRRRRVRQRRDRGREQLRRGGCVLLRRGLLRDQGVGPRDRLRLGRLRPVRGATHRRSQCAHGRSREGAPRGRECVRPPGGRYRGVLSFRAPGRRPPIRA